MRKIAFGADWIGGYRPAILFRRLNRQHLFRATTGFCYLRRNASRVRDGLLQIVIHTHRPIFMLGEYKVSRCTRRCHTLDRPLREGEWYYSVIFEDGDDFLRRDYSAESWTGLPEGGVGFWKNRIPTSDQRKLVPAPVEVLIDLLRQMESMPAKAKSRFLLALTLLRRKAVRDVTPPRSRVASGTTNHGNSDQGNATPELLCLEVLVDSSRIDVPVCEITSEEQNTLRDELQELLYCEADPDT